MQPPVTVEINTLNEEANLPGCLESVPWAAEVVLVLNADERVSAGLEVWMEQWLYGGGHP